MQFLVSNSSTTLGPLHRHLEVLASELTRGLATLSLGGSRSLQWSEIGMEDPNRTLRQCTASVCSGSPLLGDLLGVSRSMECDLF